MKEINLEEILKKSFNDDLLYELYKLDGNNNFLSIKDCIIAMREACNQCFDLAAEEVTLQGYEYKEDWMTDLEKYVSDDCGNITAVDKSSILKLKERIK